jgi:hypothetical protein
VTRKLSGKLKPAQDSPSEAALPPMPKQSLIKRIKKAFKSAGPTSLIASAIDNSKLGKEIKELIDDNAPAMATTVKAAANVSGAISDLSVEKIIEIVVDKAMGTTVQHVSDVVGIVLDVCALIADGSHYGSTIAMGFRITSIVLRVLRHFPGVGALETVQDFIVSFASKTAGSNLSADDDDSMLTSFFSASWKMINGSLPSMKTIKGFIGTMGATGRNLTGTLGGVKTVSSVVTWIQETITSVYLWIALHLKSSLGLKWLDTIMPCTRHSDIMLQCYEVLRKPHLIMTPKGRDHLHALRDELTAMKTEWIAASNKAIPKIVETVIKEIDALVVQVAAKNLLGTTQPTPFGIMLTGGTRRGKSELGQVITSLLAPLAQRSDTLLIVPEDGTHWDRYDNHFGVQIEELCQFPDKAVFQASTIYNLLTTVRAPLRMAAMASKSSDKGLSNFGILIANCNSVAPQFEQVDRGSFARRFPATYYVDFLPEYLLDQRDANGYPVVNAEMVAAYKQAGGDTHEILTFRKYTLFEPEVNQIEGILALPTLTYVQFRAELMASFRTNYVGVGQVTDVPSTFKDLIHCTVPLTPISRLYKACAQPNIWTRGDTVSSANQVVRSSAVTNEFSFGGTITGSLQGITIESKGGAFTVHSPPDFPCSSYNIRVTAPATTVFVITLFYNPAVPVRPQRAPRQTCTHELNQCEPFTLNRSCIAATIPYPMAPYTYQDLLLHAQTRFTQFDRLAMRLARDPDVRSLNPFAKHPLLQDWFNNITSDSHRYATITHDWIYYMKFLSTGMYNAPLTPPDFMFSRVLSAGERAEPRINRVVKYKADYWSTFESTCRLITSDRHDIRPSDVSAEWNAVLRAYGKPLPTKKPHVYAAFDIESTFQACCLLECAKRGVDPEDEDFPYNWIDFPIQNHNPPCVPYEPNAEQVKIYTPEIMDKIRAFATTELTDANAEDVARILGEDVDNPLTPAQASALAKTVLPEGVLSSVWDPNVLTQFIDVHTEKRPAMNGCSARVIYHCKLKDLPKETQIPDEVFLLLVASDTFRQAYFSHVYGKYRSKWGAYAIISGSSIGDIVEVTSPSTPFKPRILNMISKAQIKCSEHLVSLKHRFTEWVKNHKLLSAAITIGSIGLIGYGIYKLSSIFTLSSGPMKFTPTADARINRVIGTGAEHIVDNQLSTSAEASNEFRRYRMPAMVLSFIMGTAAAAQLSFTVVQTVRLYRSVERRQNPIVDTFYNDVVVPPLARGSSRFFYGMADGRDITIMTDTIHVDKPQTLLDKIAEFFEPYGKEPEPPRDQFIDDDLPGPSGYKNSTFDLAERATRATSSVSSDSSDDVSSINVSSSDGSTIVPAPIQEVNRELSAGDDSTPSQDPVRAIYSQFQDHIVPMQYDPCDGTAIRHTIGFRTHGRWLLFSAHLMAKPTSKGVLTIIIANPLPVPIKIIKPDFVYIRDSDPALLLLPPGVQEVSSMVKKFQQPLYVNGVHSRRPLKGAEIITLVPHVHQKTLRVSVVPIPGTVHDTVHSICTKGFNERVENIVLWHGTTTAKTTRGDCGSPVVIFQKSGIIIVGTHVSDSPIDAGFNYIDQSDLLLLVEEYKRLYLPSGDLRTLALSSYTVLPPTLIDPKGNTISLVLPSKPVQEGPVVRDAALFEDLKVVRGDQETFGRIQKIGSTTCAPHSGNDVIRTCISEHPAFPLTMEPADLYTHYPDHQPLEGCNAVPEDVSLTAFWGATDYITARDAALIPAISKRFVDLDEFLNGTHFYGGELKNSTSNRPPLSSSATFPWNKLPGCTQFRHLLDSTILKDGSEHLSFRNDIAAQMEQATLSVLENFSRGEVGHFAGGFLKSEKRPLKSPSGPPIMCRYCCGTLSHEKVQKPRLVACPTKAHSLATNFLFGSWAETRIEQRHLIANQIGVDCRRDWTHLGHKLKKFPRFFATDAKFFDKTVAVAHSNIAALSAFRFMFGTSASYEPQFRDYMTLTMTPQKRRFLDAAFPCFAHYWNADPSVRKDLYAVLRLQALKTYSTCAASFVSMYVAIGSSLFFMFRSESSGIKITGDFNGCINEALIFQAIHDLTGEPFEEIQKRVCIFTYGDDMVFSTDLDIFLPELVGAMRKFGFLVTPANKGTVVPESMLFEDLTFLKRSWLPIDDRTYSCPLDQSVIDNMWYWQKKDIPKFAAAISAVAVMITEYAEYPEEIFYRRCALIQKHLEDRGITANIPTYDEVRRGVAPLFNGRVAPAYLLKE